jgi:hypothetical protein
MQLRTALAALAAAASAGAAGAQTPNFDFQVIRADGRREEVSIMTNYVASAVAQLEVLPARVALGRFNAPRTELGGVCLPGAKPQQETRPAQDTIVWSDGTRTTGYVVSLNGVIEQNGRRLDRPLKDASCLLFGRSPPPQRLASAYAPTSIHVTPRAQRMDWWGEYTVFRFPWVEITPDAVVINGASRPRGEHWVLGVGEDTDHNYHHSPRAPVDTVAWKDGTKTTGTVLVRDGKVLQPGRPARSLREVAHVEFGAPAAPGAAITR